MLWPLLLEFSEPGPPVVHHAQQQGNMALFLTLFILTVVEVLIVKVSQTEVTSLLLPHDPPYGADSDEEVDYDDNENVVHGSEW